MTKYRHAVKGKQREERSREKIREVEEVGTANVEKRQLNRTGEREGRRRKVKEKK